MDQRELWSVRVCFMMDIIPIKFHIFTTSSRSQAEVVHTHTLGMQTCAQTLACHNALSQIYA